jgi:DNA-binding transcriptional LysR family regulator
MTDRQLEYILTISEEGNFTVAAEKLFISQPSLSALLAKVEADYGAKLFERSTSPVRLTYAGECYVQAARQILTIQKELRDKIFDIQNEEAGKLTVGCGQHTSSDIFPLIIPVFKRRYPKIQLNLLEDNVSYFEKLLIADSLDLVFTTAPIYNNAIQSVPLYAEEVLLFTPPSLPVGGRVMAHQAFPVCDMAFFKEQPFVLFKKGRYLRHLSDRIFEDSKIVPCIILETNSWETCLSMVEKGLACTLLPYPPFKQNLPIGTINKYSIKNKPLRTISLCYKKRVILSKNIERFVSLSKEAIKKYIDQKDCSSSTLLL